MRTVFLLIIMCCFALRVSAQLPKKVKYDGVTYSADSTLALVIYKGKAALYDCTKKEYKVEPGTAEITYLPDVDCFLEKKIQPGSFKLHEPAGIKADKKSTGFLLEEKIPPSGNDTLPFYTYSFVTFDGRALFLDKSAEEMLADKDLWTYAIKTFLPDTIFDAPGGKFHHELKDTGNHYYYAAVAGEMGIVSPRVVAHKLLVKWSAKPEEFVHYNPDLDFEFWLEDDSIYFKCGHRRAVVSQAYGKIRYTADTDAPYHIAGYELLTTDNGITRIDSFHTDFYWNKNVAEIFMYKGYLIVNDCSTYKFPGDPNRTSHYITLQSENASAWKKINGSWTRICPYYASVNPVPGGFITTSGYHLESWGEGNDMAWKEQKSRYFLLDTSGRAIPFMDYYDFPLIEDLGFGLKVCLDSGGCFFVTYNHIAVTNAEWDHFELYNGKLQASRFEKPLLDENGNQVYDENGVPLKASRAVTMFFKIP